MIIYPAIDLKGGQCVRLYQGSFEQVTTYDTDPISVACDYQNQGAKYLHVVDLDGAKTGQPAHLEVITKIIEQTNLQVQMGGGIRTEAYAQQLLELGVQRIIVGSKAIKNVDEVKHWVRNFGAERIVLALDIKFNEAAQPMLQSEGWLESAALNLWQLLDQYQDVKIQHVLCTDISCDGTLAGPNLELYRACVARYPEIQFQASGGIGDLDDLRDLQKIPVAGAVVGKALYEKKFTLSKALADLVGGA